MTGTALTEEEEFGAIYKLDIVEIPSDDQLLQALDEHLRHVVHLGGLLPHAGDNQGGPGLVDEDGVHLVHNGEVHHINQAIKAHGVMKRDIDYVIKDGQVIIVDEFTGRLMFARRYSEGLHQAIASLARSLERCSFFSMDTVPTSTGWPLAWHALICSMTARYLAASVL